MPIISDTVSAPQSFKERESHFQLKTSLLRIKFKDKASNDNHDDAEFIHLSTEAYITAAFLSMYPNKKI